MKQIQQITDSPWQEMTLILDDGSSFALELYYMPMQLGWFIRNLTYNDFIVNNIRICNTPNILHQFRNLIPFGLACMSVENREPTLSEDFNSENSKLFILTEGEVDEFEEFLSGQV